MKKMGLLLGLTTAGLMGMGAYVLINKNTKTKADKLINNMLDKANNLTSNNHSSKKGS